MKERWSENPDNADEKVNGVSFHLKSISRIAHKWMPVIDTINNIKRNNISYASERRDYEDYIRNRRAQLPETRARNLNRA